MILNLLNYNIIKFKFKVFFIFILDYNCKIFNNFNFKSLKVVYIVGRDICPPAIEDCGYMLHMYI